MARTKAVPPMLMTMADSYFGAYGSASVKSGAGWPGSSMAVVRSEERVEAYLGVGIRVRTGAL